MERESSSFNGGKPVTVVLLGGPGVGKSALTLRLINENFVKDYDPTIEDKYKKEIILDDEVIDLRIVDTAGNDDFKILIDNWITEGDGFLLTFAINDAESLKKLETKKMRIHKIKDTYKVPIILVGTKSDLKNERTVTVEEAEELAKKWNIEYIETSAKLKERSEEPFLKIIKAVLAPKQRPVVPENSGCKRFCNNCIII